MAAKEILINTFHDFFYSSIFENIYKSDKNTLILI